MTFTSATSSSLVALVIAVAVLLGLPPAQAVAHPLGNFTVNHYARIEVYRDVVRVHYVLDFAEIPSFEEMGDIDPDSNGATEDELVAWAARRATAAAADLKLAIDGVPLTPRALLYSGASAPGQSNLPVLRFEAVYEAAVPSSVGAGDEVPLEFSDTHMDDRRGWREIVIAPSAGASVTVPAGYEDRSSMLRAYPATSLEDAPDEREVAFRWTARTGTAGPAPSLSAEGPAARDQGGFPALVARDQSPLVLIMTFMAAAGFGMVHALGPGHGKAVVAAYLVGSRGTPRHAVGLGLTVTATHTASVYALGIVALTASQFIVPEQLYLSLSIVSGVLVTVFGATLLGRRVRQPRHHGEHVHGPGGEHSHGKDAAHSHGHAHTQSQEGGASWRSVLALGVFGGLLPCPSAVVVMLAAISVGEVLFGLLLIVAFSAGLAGVLTGLGLAVVIGGRVTERFRERGGRTLDRLRLVQRVVYLGSPAAIMLFGLVLTIRALGDRPLG
ncbi:MAG: nickel/cobalt transporter [Dehalococcoidia bacterium]